MLTAELNDKHNGVGHGLVVTCTESSQFDIGLDRRLRSDNDTSLKRIILEV